MKTANPWKLFDKFYRATGGQVMKQCKSSALPSKGCPNYDPRKG